MAASLCQQSVDGMCDSEPNRLCQKKLKSIIVKTSANNDCLTIYLSFFNQA